MRLASYPAAAALLLFTTIAFAQSSGPYVPSEQEPLGQATISDEAFRNLQAPTAPASVFQKPSAAVDIEAVAVESANTVACVPNCGCGQCDTCCENCAPRWDFQFLSLLLWRDNDSQNGDLIRPHALDFDTGGGPKLLGRLLMNPSQAWEAQWYAVANDAGKMYYNWSNFYVTDYRSSLSNGEINFVHTWNRFSLLGGFRALRWSETYEELYTPAGTELHMHTDNDLFGGQFGARWRQDRQNYYWEVTGKFGVFGNQANESQLVTYGYGHSGFTAFPRQYDFTTSIVYDLNLAFGWRLSQVWSLRTGYNFLFIDRLALAPNQYSLVGRRDVLTSGNVLLNGFEIGLEAMW
jgi:hypothetical protein